MGPSKYKRKESKSDEWRTARKRETLHSLELEFEKLLQTAPAEEEARWRIELNGFKSLFIRFLRAQPTIDWDLIDPLPAYAIRPYEALPAPDWERSRALLEKLVVVKLNGGLGTSMGCKGPKSVITVREDLTFLDLTMQQIESLNIKYNVDVPLVLMNSFHTDEDTGKVLRKYKNVQVRVYSFDQSKYPRINKETLVPIASSLQKQLHDDWYPPGHGNFYEAFHHSGLLDQFLKENKEVCFVSNIDNLGATADPVILNFMLQQAEEHRSEFLMEVTDKTRADIKGGTLINYEGRLRLLEMAQVPKEHVDEFKSINKFKIFNTNNLWVSLAAMKRLMDAGGLDLEVLVNSKHLEQGVDVLQLETAAGAAIKSFNGALGVDVPRNRYLPVKKTQDLLLVMSNLYEMENGCLRLSSQRSFPTTPLIKLGSSFTKVSDFVQRFDGVPDILDLDHLTVSGDVWFGKGVSIKGTVIIVANQGDRIDIPPKAQLENKTLSGNLRILDH